MQKTILETRALTKRYGSLTAVDHLDLEIKEGEIFGFLGPNGAGKTTTIQMICGLLKPDGGRSCSHGKPVSGSDNHLHMHVGMCPQSNLLWGKLTCLEQLEFLGQMYDLPASKARERGRGLLAAVGLEDKASQLAATLSGGMQRRLNLVLGLIHDPQVLVLDEPEAGLDPQSRVLVREYIRQWARSSQKTVILTTHNMDEADRLADRVAIIDRGALLVLDTPAALKHSLGSGDVLEIGLDLPAGLPPECALEAARRVSTGAVLSGNRVVIQSPGALDLLAPLQSALKQAGVGWQQVLLRENTLEDVFISLTGRSLRE